MTFIKFCGMTREADVARACELGVDAVGFVLWSKSPRATDVSRVRAMVQLLPPDITPVGVFVSPTADEVARARDAGVRVAQIYGTDAGGIADRLASCAEEIWVARSLEADIDTVGVDVTLVLDAADPVRHGGTGQRIDWARAAAIAARRRVLLAGGLTAVNVREAVLQVRPFGVDVASGIEERAGVKNAQAMRDFVAAVREADQ